MGSFHQWQALQRAKVKVNRLQPLLQHNWNYLDVGCGNGAVAHLLQSMGTSIQCVDVIDKCLFHDVKPVVYDGQQLPYADSSFDAVLLITVLHHVSDVMELLLEAKRVAKYQVVVMEDIYNNHLQRWITLHMDSLVNAEWKGHPHNNRSHNGWLEAFESIGLRYNNHTFHRFGGVFLQVTYQLQA